MALETDGSPSNVTIYDGDNGGYGGPWEFDWANNRLLFSEEAENANIWGSISIVRRKRLYGTVRARKEPLQATDVDYGTG